MFSIVSIQTGTVGVKGTGDKKTANQKLGLLLTVTAKQLKMSVTSSTRKKICPNMQLKSATEVQQQKPFCLGRIGFNTATPLGLMLCIYCASPSKFPFRFSGARCVFSLQTCKKKY